MALLVVVPAYAQDRRQEAVETSGDGASPSVEPLTVMSWNLEWFYDEQQGDNFSSLGKE